MKIKIINRLMNAISFNPARIVLGFVFILATMGFAQGQCPTAGAALIKTHTDISCFGADDGTITVELGNGNAPINFELYDLALGSLVTFAVTETNDPDGNGNFRKVKYSGVYPSSFAVNVFRGGCPTIQITQTAFGFVVNEPTQVTASVNTITPACTTGTGAIALDVSGGTPGYTYVWSGPTVIGSVEDPTNLNSGTYSVTVRDANYTTAGLCDASLSNIVVPAPPTAFNLTGGGSYCSASPTAQSIGLSGSEVGVNYTLFRGASSIETIAGTGSALSFTSQTTVGAYTVQALNVSTTCTNTMTGSAVIVMNASPTSAVLSGSNTVCAGTSTDLVVNITGGTSPYTLTINNGVGTINNYVSGTAIPVAPGSTTSYSIVGSVTDASSCSVAGSGGATVTVNPSITSAVLSGTTAVCSGTGTNLIVTITGGTSPYTLTINNGVGILNNYVSGTPIPVNPGATTTYNIVGNVTDASSCSVAGSGSATVTVNPSITSAVLSGTTAVCSGTSTNLIVTITGGTSPYTVTINNGVGTINNYVSGTAIPVAPGATTSYSIVGSVTDASSCSVAGSGGATVTVNPSITSAVLSGTTVVCNGTGTNLIVTITGGTSPYSLTINNGIGTINNYVSGTAIPVNPGATTSYSIVGNVTDASSCSVAGSGGATVTVNPSITSAVLSGTTTVCSGTSTNLIVTITGGTSPYTVTIDNGVGTINNYVSGTAIPVAPGATTSYSIVGSVTDASSCSVAGSGGATVTVNPSITSAVLSGTTAVCSGTGTNLIVTITGGTSPYTLTINNGVGILNNYVSGTPIPVNPGATTTYNIVGNVTDASSCSVAGSGSATVTVSPSMTSAVLSGTNTVCSGTSTNLKVIITGGTSPYTLTINNGVGTINNYVSGTSIPVAPGATTSYSMVGNVTDASSCSVAGSGGATVTVNPSITSAVLSGTTAVCSGTGTNLIVTITGGTSPYTLTINNGVGILNNYVSGTPIPVNPGATTTYNIVGNVTDASSCSVAGSGSATVTVSPSMTSAVLSGTNTVCSGTSTNLKVIITGGTSPYTLTINNGVGTINNYVSGTAIPVAPGATTSYSIVGNVTDASSCSVAGSGGATITVNPSITSAVLSGTTTVCNGTGANLTVTITGGTSPYTLTINNGVGTINNYVSGTAIPVAPGATTSYSIVGNVTDASSCSVAGSGGATVTVNPSITSAVLSGTTTICSGSSTNLAVTITGGTSPYTVTINNGVGTINNYVSGTAIPVAPGATTSYSIVGNVTDASSCSVAGSGGATVTVNPSITSAVLSGTASVCSGTSTNLKVTITGGTSPYTLTIDNGVGTINNYVSGTSITVSPAATTTYSIVGNVTDASSCSVAGSGSAIVTVNPSPTSAIISGTAAICTGSGANLSVAIVGGTSPYKIVINNGIGAINNYVSGTSIPVNPGATTTYTLVGNVTDALNCKTPGNGSATITVNAPPTSAVLSGSTTICSGASANLKVTIAGGTGPYTLTLDNGIGTINNYVSGANIPVNPGSTTTYNIVGSITDASSCSVAGSGSATVTVNPSPTSAVLSGTTTVCSGTSTDLIVTIAGGTSPYTLTIDNGVGTINNYVSGTAIPVAPGVTTTYSIVGNVTDAATCSVAGSGSAIVTVNPSITSAVLGGTTTICSGTSTNLSVIITGGTSPYTLTIDNGVGTINNYISGTAIPVSPGATTTYSITGNVTDAASCSVAGTGGATITVNPSPTSAVLSGTTTVCSGTSTDLTVTITGGTSPYTLTIDNGVGTINNYVSGTAIPVVPGVTTTYSIVGNVTDASTCGVAGSGSAIVTVNPSITSAVLIGTAAICQGSSTNLSVNVTGGTSPYTLTIDNGVGTINNYVSGTAIPVAPAVTTSYSIVGNVTDASTTCSVAGSGGATVTVNPAVTSAVLSGAATICSGTSTDLSVTITGGTSPYTLTINNGVGIINNYISGTAIPVSPGVTTTYSIVGNVTDAASCSVAGSGSPMVTVIPTPTATISGTAAICSGSSTNITINFTGSSPWSFKYSDGSTTSPSIPSFFNSITFAVNPAATTTYTLVSVLDNTICPGTVSGSAVVTVNQPPDPNLTLGATIDPLCSGGTSGVTVANSEAGVSYQLRNNSNNSLIGAPVVGTGGTITLSTGALVATTTFNVLATSAGCTPAQLSALQTVNVAGSINAALSVSALANPVCSGSATSIRVANSENGVTYQLRNDAGDVNVGVTVAGNGGNIDLPTGILIASTTFNVLASNATCGIELTDIETVNVDINPNTGLTVSVTPDPICTGGTSSIQIDNSEIGVTYQLRLDSDDSNVNAAVAGAGGTILLPTNALAATTVFNVLASGGATCTPVELLTTPTVTVSGTINTSLTVAPLANPICEGTGTSIRITNAENGINYQLRNDADDSVIGSGVGTGADLDIPTGNLNATTTYNILADNGVCSIEMTTLPTVNVEVNPDVTLAVVATLNPVCNGGNSGIQIQNSENGVTYQLRNDFDDSLVGSSVAGNGGTITLPTGVLAASTTFNVLASSGVACLPLELNTTIMINVGGTIDASLVTTANPNPICAGSATFVEIANSENGVNYQLRLDSNDSNVGAPVAGTGGTISLSTGNLNAATTFNVLANNGVCSIELTDLETVNISTSPNIALAVSATTSTICSGFFTSIVVVGSEAGVTYDLRNDADDSVIATATGTGGNLSLPTGTLLASTTYNVFATIGTCSAELTQKASVTVRPIGDPACIGSGTNCGALTIFPITTGASKIELPSCSSKDDGQLVFDVNLFAGGDSNFEFTLTRDGDPSFSLQQSGTGPFVFPDLYPDNYHYVVVDLINGHVCGPKDYTLLLQSVVTATTDNTSLVNTTCFGESTGQVIINASGSTTGEYFYSVDGNIWTKFIPGNAGQITNLPPNGTYSILVGEVQNDVCYDTAKVTINNANPDLSIDYTITSTTCNGNDGGIEITPPALPNIGGGGPYTYALSNSVDTTSFQASVDFVGLAGGTYSVLVKDKNSCIKTISNVDVTFPGFIDFSVSSTNAACTNNGKSGKINVSLSANGDYKVGLSKNDLIEPTTYRDDPFNGSTFTFDSLARGEYYVFAKSASSLCPTKSSKITINGIYAMSFGIQPLCEDNHVSIALTDIVVDQSISSFAINVYKEFDNTPFEPITFGNSSDVTLLLKYEDHAFLKTPGSYKIVIDQLQNFCSVTASVNYKVNELLSASIGKITDSYPDVATGTMQVLNFNGGLEPYGIAIVLDTAFSNALSAYQQPAGNGYDIVNLNDAFQYEMNYAEIPPGNYKISVKDSANCIVDYFAVVPMNTEIYIPNIFTPNGDEKNDTFFIRNLPQDAADLIISDRWGKEVFKSNHYSNEPEIAWNGSGVADGIYYYRLKLSVGKPITGWVEIIRGNKP